MRAMALFLAVCTCACGASAVDVAQTTITTTAEASAEVSKSIGEVYTAKSQARRAELNADKSLTGDQRFEKWAHHMRGLDAVVIATNGLRSALLAAQAAVSAWKASDSPGNWATVADCVAVAVRTLANAMEDAGMTAPPKLLEAAELVEKYAGHRCMGVRQ